MLKSLASLQALGESVSPLRVIPRAVHADASFSPSLQIQSEGSCAAAISDEP
jgi:hypothetical protein